MKVKMEHESRDTKEDISTNSQKKDSIKIRDSPVHQQLWLPLISERSFGSSGQKITGSWIPFITKSLFLACYLPALILLLLPSIIFFIVSLICMCPIISIGAIPFLGHYLSSKLIKSFQSNKYVTYNILNDPNIPQAHKLGHQEPNEGVESIPINSYGPLLDCQGVIRRAYNFALSHYYVFSKEPLTLLFTVTFVALICFFCVPVFCVTSLIFLALLPFLLIFPLFLIGLLPLLAFITFVTFGVLLSIIPRSHFVALYYTLKARLKNFIGLTNKRRHEA